MVLCNQVEPDVVGSVPPLPGNNDSVRGVIVRHGVHHGDSVSEVRRSEYLYDSQQDGPTSKLLYH